MTNSVQSKKLSLAVKGICHWGRLSSYNALWSSAVGSVCCWSCSVDNPHFYGGNGKCCPWWPIVWSASSASPRLPGRPIACWHATLWWLNPARQSRLIVSGWIHWITWASCGNRASSGLSCLQPQCWSTHACCPDLHSVVLFHTPAMDSDRRGNNRAPISSPPYPFSSSHSTTSSS